MVTTARRYRAPFRWQIEIDDFRELFLQDRHEHFIQRHAQDRRLIRRAAGIGRVVDRVATLGDVRDGKYRELVDFIVVTGVVAVGPSGAISPGSI